MSRVAQQAPARAAQQDGAHVYSRCYASLRLPPFAAACCQLVIEVGDAITACHHDVRCYYCRYAIDDAVAARMRVDMLT